MAPRGRHSAASMMQANTNSRPALAPGNDKIADFLLVKQNLNILLVCLVPLPFPLLNLFTRLSPFNQADAVFVSLPVCLRCWCYIMCFYSVHICK